MTNKSPSLQQLVSEVLGHPYYEELYGFFQKVFFTADKRVVFVTRRCFCIGFLFARIFRDNGKDVEFERFFSDSALIDSGFLLGAKLPEGESPEVLLVDDSISYGRATRGVLESLFLRVADGFQSVNGDKHSADYLSPLQYVQSKVEIHVYADKKQQLVLPSFYHRSVRSERICDDAEWNEISNRLSELLNVGDIANAAFVLSAGANSLPEEDRKGGWAHIITSYRQLTQHTWFKIIPTNGQPSAICSVRCVQSGIENRFRYIPFVFLPILGHQELEQLEAAIFERIRDCGDRFVQDICQSVCQLRQNTTSRRRMEFVTFYLSHSVLLSFMDDFGLELDESAFDIDKIAWNYTVLSDATGAVKQLLRVLCQKKYKSCLLSENELCTWIRELPGKLPDAVSLNFEPRGWNRQSEEKAWICLENLLFDLGVQAEGFAHNCVIQNSSPGDATLDSLNEKRCDELFSFVRKLQEELCRTDGIAYLLACILQMMDSGAMSIVISDAPDGTKQQIRICEQAMFLLPRRCSCYMAVLRALDRYSSYPLELKRARITSFVNQLRQLQESVEGDDQHLFRLLDGMKKSAQAVENWDIRLDRHFVIDSKTGLAYWDSAMEERQIKKREKYMQLWTESQKTY